MRDSPNHPTRRGFLRDAGIVSALAVSSSRGILERFVIDPQDSRPGDAKETLDALLKKHRNRVLLADGRIGGTLAHVPLALMALYRIGASPAQMQRFFGDDAGTSRRPSFDLKDDDPLTAESWKGRLRKGVPFSRWCAFFDGWMERTSVESVLKEALPTLLDGGVSAFDHTLIHMSYSIDYGGREEIAHALADWANARGADQQIDLAPDAVEPDALLAEIIKSTSDLKLSPRGGNSGSIVWRLDQVYRCKEFSKKLKPVRIPDADPLRRFSEIILDLFCETHEFTLLHALTTCQALRTLLPHVRDPKTTLSAYWHSVCASYVTVRRMPQFEAAKQTVPTGRADWKEIIPRAAEMDRTIHESQYVHRVKLVYSCRQEFNHYKLDLYRAVSAREVERASQIILG